MSKGGIYFDMGPMKRFSRKLRQSVSVRPTGAMAGVFTKWGVRYLAETKRKYIANSRGGGDWPPLAAATIRQRRGTTAAMLRDTGTLLGALDVGARGNLFKFIKGGIRVGFGGPARHPNGGVSIRDLAVIHDQGEGKMPKRQILRRPSKSLLAKMKLDLMVGIKKLGWASR